MNKLSWIDKIFVINLDLSVDRLNKCEYQSKKYNFQFERFTAIDGSKLTKTQKNYVHPICKTLLCTNGMIGCGLSHLFILKKIIDENIQTTLVLEDDFVWRNDSIEKINKLKNFDKGIVKLSCIGPFCKSESEDEPSLCELALGNAAYLIRYNQAKILYEKLQNVIYHIDVQYAFTSKFNHIPIYYFDCIDVEGMEDSTIGDNNSTLLKQILPLSPTISWVLSEPFISPLGLKINLFFCLSIIILILGIVFYKKFQGILKYIGLFFILFGILDLFFYFQN